MVHLHSHGHGHHHGHDDDDDHGHSAHDHLHEELPDGTGPRARLRVAMRFGIAALIVIAAVMTASSVMVPAGQATVVTRFGDLVRVVTKPGLAWKLPTPIDNTIPVDLRLRTTSTGLQDVGTKDGLRILVQAYVAWQVPDDPERVRQFLRAVRNDPDEAARQLRSFVGSALQVTASSFDLADLVDTDPSKLQIAAFEDRLRTQVEAQTLAIYGVRIVQVGVERLSLPATTLAATVERMRAERETVAAERTAAGLRAAAEIRSEASRDSRIVVAKARTEAADVEAASREQAASIYARAYASDPELYTMLRSIDTLGSVVGANTRLILRTDSPPFNVLVDGPPKSVAAPAADGGTGRTVSDARP